MSHLIPELEELGHRLEEGLARRRLPRALLGRLPRALAPAAAVAAAALLVGALLATHHTEPERRPVATSAPGSEQELREMLGVLRRPQSAAERSLERQGLDKTIEPGTLRILGPGAVRGQVFLYLTPRYPFEAGGSSGNRPAAVCVSYPDAGGVTCGTAEMIRRPYVLGALGRHTYGVVPDGVASVAAVFGSRAVDATPRNNYWELRAPRTGPPASVLWRDASGRRTATATLTPTPTPAPRPPPAQLGTARTGSSAAR